MNKVLTMDKKIGVCVILTLSILFGCETKKDTTLDAQNVTKTASFKGEEVFENKITAIDSDTQLSFLNSLSYNNNEGSTIEVIAYLNKADSEVKIEEIFSDVPSGNYGRNIFYIEEGKKIATKQVFFDNQRKEPTFVEIITYYDAKENPIYAKERITEYEEDLEEAVFTAVSPKVCSIAKAMRVLNKEKEFETTFQGFVSDGTLNYVLVGENTENGFASSLAVQYSEGDVRKLLNNEKAMIGKPLTVTHEVMEDERGLKFQVLLSLKIN